MIKKIKYLPLGVFVYIQNAFAVADEAPRLNCIGLPGCVDGDKANPTKANVSDNIGGDLIVSVISQLIQYVAVIAVISLMLSGIMYLLSGGEEEKTNRAKKWIIWSLVGVFLSVSAWGIIQILNTLELTGGIG